MLLFSRYIIFLSIVGLLFPFFALFYEICNARFQKTLEKRWKRVGNRQTAHIWIQNHQEISFHTPSAKIGPKTMENERFEKSGQKGGEKTYIEYSPDCATFQPGIIYVSPWSKNWTPSFFIVNFTNYTFLAVFLYYSM